MRFTEVGTVSFRSPDCNAFSEAPAPAFTGDPRDEKAGAIYTRRVSRNGLNKEGKRIGYGVITGEPEVLQYLASGNFSANAGDRIAAFTDGFEPYMRLWEFWSFVGGDFGAAKEAVRAFSEQKISQDPETFGHERTLAVLPVL